MIDHLGIREGDVSCLNEKQSHGYVNARYPGCFLLSGEGKISFLYRMNQSVNLVDEADEPSFLSQLRARGAFRKRKKRTRGGRMRKAKKQILSRKGESKHENNDKEQSKCR